MEDPSPYSKHFPAAETRGARATRAARPCFVCALILVAAAVEATREAAHGRGVVCGGDPDWSLKDGREG